MESGANGFPHFLTDVQPAKPGLGEGFFASLSFQCECFTRFVVVVVLNPVLSFWVLALCQGSMYGVERCPVFVLPPLTVHSQRPLSRDVLSHLCRAIDS